MPHWQPDGIGGRLGQDLRDREPVLPAHGHEDARHQREVERHLALVAADLRVAEVLDHVGRPLVGLGQQHPARVLVVHHLAAALEELVGLGEVLAVGALALEQVGHRVQPEPVDAQVQPEPQDVDHRVLHVRVVVVQVGLVGEEPVPVELAAHRVVGPVRRLGVDEDDPRVRVARSRRRTRRRSRRRARRGCGGTPRTTGAGREVWFMTRSVITRMPRLCASSSSTTKSSTVPNSGSTARKSRMS